MKRTILKTLSLFVLLAAVYLIVNSCSISPADDGMKPVADCINELSELNFEVAKIMEIYEKAMITNDENLAVELEKVLREFDEKYSVDTRDKFFVENRTMLRSSGSHDYKPRQYLPLPDNINGGVSGASSIIEDVLNIGECSKSELQNNFTITTRNEYNFSQPANFTWDRVMNSRIDSDKNGDKELEFNTTSDSALSGGIFLTYKAKKWSGVTSLRVKARMGCQWSFGRNDDLIHVQLINETANVVVKDWAVNSLDTANKWAWRTIDENATGLKAADTYAIRLFTYERWSPQTAVCRWEYVKVESGKINPPVDLDGAIYLSGGSGDLTTSVIRSIIPGFRTPGKYHHAAILIKDKYDPNNMDCKCFLTALAKGVAYESPNDWKKKPNVAILVLKPEIRSEIRYLGYGQSIIAGYSDKQTKYGFFMNSGLGRTGKILDNVFGIDAAGGKFIPNPSKIVSKDNNEFWYCTKVVWRVYNNIFDTSLSRYLDIDSNTDVIDWTDSPIYNLAYSYYIAYYTTRKWPWQVKSAAKEKAKEYMSSTKHSLVIAEEIYFSGLLTKIYEDIRDRD